MNSFVGLLFSLSLGGGGDDGHANSTVSGLRTDEARL